MRPLTGVGCDAGLHPERGASRKRWLEMVIKSVERVQDRTGH